MIKKGVYSLVLLCSLFLPNAWSAEISADALLVQMKTAFNQLNYDLSYVEIERGRITPMRYSHGVIDNISVGHLLSLNGTPHEYLQRGEITSFFEPEQQPYSLMSASIPGLLFNLMAADISASTNQYQAIYVGGRSRITGRLSQVVRVVPTDKYRFGYLIWIDLATSLPLRIDMIKDTGEVVFQVMAVSLYQFPEVTPWLVKLNAVELPPVVKLADTDKAEKTQHEMAWKVSWLPSGFDLIVANKHQIAGIKQTVDYMQFSDGLVDISVYINSDPKGGRLTQGLGISGQLSLQSKVTDDVEIVVVGEVPLLTAQKIADSVIRNITN